jgi:aminopeptidase N
MADRLVEIDRRNPQIAARMALPMTRMANYDAARRDLMRAALVTIKAGAASNDLKEVVDKAL